MTTKTAIGIFVAITTLFVVAVWSTDSMSEEVTIDTKVKNFVVSEWNEIKEFQKDNWQDGKDQLARNKEQISNLFLKVQNIFKN
tara:strand:- start:5912 stop:6163 length:252 start_codon:yes stop_codon:yes gene_type:complete